MAAISSMCLRRSPHSLLFLQRKFLAVEIVPRNVCTFNNIMQTRTHCFTGRSICEKARQKLLAGSVKRGLASLTNPACSVTLPMVTPQGQYYYYSTDEKQSSTLKADDISKDKIGETQSDKKEEKKGKYSQWFSGKNAWKLGLLSLTGMGFLMCGNLLLLWGAPSLDQLGNELRDEFSDLPKWQAYPRRAMKEFHFFKKMIQEPSSEKLLPDPVKEPYYQPPYTLVLEMTGVLVHPDWTMSTGWRFKKRPGIEYFLQQVAPPLFEIVIYTHEQGFTAFPIIDGLDTQQCVSFRLFRDATRYMNGHHVKDLGCLNRDLSKVIIVDCDPNSFQLHPRNAICMPKWNGADGDHSLIDLAAFLRTIAVSDVEDVRTVLDHYNQFDDPLEAFKENQRRLQVEQDNKSKVQVEDKSLASNWSFGLTGRRR